MSISTKVIKTVKCHDGINRPTTFSNGRFIAANEMDIPSFWSWFERSTMVDDEGRPIAFYHGAASKDGEQPFDRFSSKKSKWNGLIFFSSDYSWAQDFITTKAAIYETDTYIFTAALKVSRLLDSMDAVAINEVIDLMSDDDFIQNNRYVGGITHKLNREEFRDAVLKSKENWTLCETEGFISAAKKVGFDAIRVYEGSCTSVAVFDDSSIYVANQKLEKIARPDNTYPVIEHEY